MHAAERKAVASAGLQTVAAQSRRADANKLWAEKMALGTSVTPRSPPIVADTALTHGHTPLVQGWGEVDASQYRAHDERPDHLNQL
jgi:hypothetical protein